MRQSILEQSCDGSCFQGTSKVALLKWLAFRLHSPGFVVSHVYLTMVRPSLEYAAAVWNSCLKMDVLTLEKTQVKIARIVLHLEGQQARLSDSAVLEKFEWPALAWRRRLASLCLFWQLKNGLGPPRLTGRLPAPASEHGPHSLRYLQILQYLDVLPSSITNNFFLGA